MNMPMPKESFLKIADTKLRDEVLYGILEANLKVLCEIKEGVSSLEKKYDRRKRVDTAASFGGGIVGGISAIAGKAAFWK